MSKRRILIKRILYTLFILLAVVAVGTYLFLQQPSFGKLPEGARLARIQQSENFKNGIFQNQTITPNLATDKSKFVLFTEFFFQKIKDLRPTKDVPAIKTDLKALNRKDNLVVWLGHSSLYMQLDGKRFLVDPVLLTASPISFVNKAFRGADAYHPQDIPDIDYLLITHDHWDHLDYETMVVLKNRVGKVVCPLGVASHLEYWGFDPARIVEHDWFDSVVLDEHLKINTLPARHFSGRGLQPNKTLWASYLLESASAGKVYISGDTGYEAHFKAIGERFGEIDFAIMENGQYNADWRYIHMMPEDLVQAVKDLKPKRFFTVHNSKYALGKHAWYEPLENIYSSAQRDSLPLVTPMIGEPLYLETAAAAPKKWWVE
ncbi:MBL fold metallo-hydrolase [Sphingobacterium psychroaquaticum]|uniref:MBL fold metallo-hydrolase n=1 Tax=Sphingobacterium psychroaquaticum TaxID=561061 RepID=UPI00106C53F4|nr:MBL fold metallo-hydrolase [Sphingobacterium psychroaquaticum]QBQ41798.1 MBL fold metallo-hydrolase [Sphingobacterium psychroaquaticum]